jgi:hypothetical protein
MWYVFEAHQRLIEVLIAYITSYLYQRQWTDPLP